MKPVCALLAFVSLLLPVVPQAASSAAGDRAAPPACDPSASPCERLNWVEQTMWARETAAIPSLREAAASDAHARVRERSVGALVTLGDAGAAEVLLDRMEHDPAAAVRRAAAEGIGVLKPGIPIARLTMPLRKDPNPLVRAECARAIGRLGQAAGVPALIVAITQDPSPEVRALSAEALALLRAPEGIEPLKYAAAWDAAPSVRYHAVKGLADFAPAPAHSVFLEVLENTNDPELRVEAFRGLLLSGRGGGWIESGMADADKRIRFLAFQHWISGLRAPREHRVERGDDVVRRVEPFLSDPVRGIRDLAKAYLEKLGFKVQQSGLIYVLSGY